MYYYYYYTDRYQILLCTIIFLRGVTSDVVCVVYCEFSPDSHTGDKNQRFP